MFKPKVDLSFGSEERMRLLSLDELAKKDSGEIVSVREVSPIDLYHILHRLDVDTFG